MKKKIIIVAIFLIAVLFIVFIRNRVSSKEIDVFSVASETVISKVSASGNISAKEDIALKFELSGKVNWIGVKEGDYVNKYQAIASIDASSYYSDLATTESLYRKAISSYTEVLETYKTEEPTNILRERITQAQENVEYYRLLVESKKNTLSKRSLISPIEGKVVSLDIERGELVTASTTVVARVVNLDSSFFSAEISDADVTKIKLDQEASITFDTTEEVYTGFVSKISNISDLNSSGETIFLIDITFDKAKELPIGLKGDAEIILKEYKSAICIDTESILIEKDKYFVFVIEDNKAIKKEITTPLELDSCSLVNSLASDTLVIFSPSDVKNGMKVTPIVN